MKVTPPALAAGVLLAALVGCATPTDGGGGGGGTGGTTDPQVCTPGEPAPATADASFPFPQHRLSPYCYYPPACSDDDVRTSWDKFKATFVVPAGNGLRVQRPEAMNDTVSEGIGYAMIAAVYMTDKPTFDGLWAYTQAHFKSGVGLMFWHITASGQTASDAGGGATDADEDIAFALMMADKQWPNGGYRTPALSMIGAILSHEVEGGTNVLKPGDNFGGSSRLNPSYIAPAYYRAFAAYTGNGQWTSVLSANNQVLARCANPSTGLVPDWCTASGQAIGISDGATATQYSYDAARTPFRVALDACWSGDSAATELAGRYAAFFAGMGLNNVRDGYTLSGSPTGTSFQLVFQAPAAVAGMAANNTKLVDDGYGRIRSVVLNNTTAYNYFGASWGLLAQLLMTGNFVDLTAL